MKIRPFAFSILLILTLVSASPLYAEDSSVEKLSPELRTLLSKEMFALQEAMMAMIPAYSAGDTNEIASIAIQIQDSFILKKSLTAEQKLEIDNTLPKAFLELDAQFHNNAAKLEEAARQKDFEQISYYLKQMTEACYGCHSQYAMHKFKALIAPAGK